MSDVSVHNAECEVMMLIKNDSLQTHLTTLSDFRVNGKVLYIKGTIQMQNTMMQTNYANTLCCNDVKNWGLNGN